MGGNASGALNASGFSQSLASNQLPLYTHITHNGIINENFFEIGAKANKLLQIHSTVAVSNCQLPYLPERNYFAGLFLKSSTDGQKRTAPLNVVIALDVSGSMDSSLKNEMIAQGQKFTSRLTLSRKAIEMLYDKLQPDDVFGLITFHTTAKTIIPSTPVSMTNRDIVFEMINSKFETGGTTIDVGFKEALKNINTARETHGLNGHQHRIVMLTDVCDNSVAGEETFIEDIASAGTHTTLIGVSTDFKSETCEKLIEVKGFNYMSAVQEADLQTYLVDQFDYTFFPCVQNVKISINSKMIKEIEVFGTVDHNIKYAKEGNCFTVTKMKTGFPSQLNKTQTGKILTKGGLIIVKFYPVDDKQLPDVQMQIVLTYSDLKGNSTTQSYPLSCKVTAQEFYSQESIRKGVYLFYYTETIRRLLKAMHENETQLNEGNRADYLEKFQKLQGYCPVGKEQQLKKLISIVRGSNPEEHLKPFPAK